MSPKPKLFLFYGSIYTYLTVMRVDRVATDVGLEVEWVPFNLREILIEQDNTAFTRNPVRMRYSWRDVERRAKRHGLPFKSQPPYPVDRDLLALRIGVLAALEGWCADYSRATFRSWFVEHKQPGSEACVNAVLTALGKDARSITAQANSASVLSQLARNTDAARELGVFGSPTVAVGREIFWGDDRLDEAIEHALAGSREP